MKRRIIFFTLFTICICFIGCNNSLSDEVPQTYKVEIGVIANSTYNNAMSRISGWSEVSYANIASLRLYLYNNTISDHEILTGVSIEEIKDFLLSRGMSNYEANSEIELLKTIGNDIVFAEHATDSTKKVWMYSTK